MRIASAVITVLALLFGATASAAPTAHSSPKEARAMFEKAVALLEKEGPKKALAAFNDPKGEFVKGDLYVFVFDMEGTYQATGAAPAMVGMNVRETRDAAGNPVIQQIVEVARTRGEGTVSYVWLDRHDNRVDNKTSFVKRVGDLVVGVGYYTPRATAEQARAFLENAVALMQKEGAEKAFAAFNDPRGRFVRDDLYVFALDLNGTYKASGVNPALSGLNVRDTRDAAGEPLFQNMIAVAKGKGEGTVNYVWRNPADNSVEKKTSYIKRVGDYLLGVGYYTD